jgi:hypothetical protein
MFDRSESKDSNLTPEQASLETKLARLTIAPPKLDRDQLMFNAGRAAALRDLDLAATQRGTGAPCWFWPTASGLLAAACLVLSAMLVWPNDGTTIADRNGARMNEAMAIEPPSADELRDVERLATRAGIHWWSAPPAGGYLEQRYIALTRGVGEVPAGGEIEPGGSRRTIDRPTTARELLREFIPTNDLGSSSNS